MVKKEIPCCTHNDGHGCVCGKRHDEAKDYGHFYEIEIENLEEIHDIQKEHESQEPVWAYRGQPDATDPLETLLERVYKQKYGNLPIALKNGDVLKAEKTILREFKRRYHQYAQHIPKKNDDLEWLSIMQHHGAPTRLLDWTYSIYVATYFALERAEKDCAVWAMNGTWSRKTVNEELFPGELEPGIENMEKYRKKFMHRVVTCSESCVRMISPFRLNERLTLQQGVFACQTNMRRSFEDNVKAMDGYDKPENMIKIVIPHGMRKDAIKWLYRADINRTVLFPGLDGFAKSLSVNFREYTDKRF